MLAAAAESQKRGQGAEERRGGERQQQGPERPLSASTTNNKALRSPLMTFHLPRQACGERQKGSARVSVRCA